MKEISMRLSEGSEHDVRVREVYMRWGEYIYEVG